MFQFNCHLKFEVSLPVEYSNIGIARILPVYVELSIKLLKSTTGETNVTETELFKIGDFMELERALWRLNE